MSKAAQVQALDTSVWHISEVSCPIAMTSFEWKKILTFSGYSDDLFCLESSVARESNEWEAFDHPVHLKLWSESEKAGLIVSGSYGTLGPFWMIGVSLLNENIFPSWKSELSMAKNGYSVRLEFIVPFDTEVVQIRDDL